MPELPEVETVVRQLRKTVVGKRIVSGRIYRQKIVRHVTPRSFLSRIRGAEISGVNRRAKYILFRLDNGKLWIAHLGMTGKFVVERTGDGDRKYVRALFTLDDGSRLVFVDVRIFGMMTVVPEDKEKEYFRNIGVEPLGRDFTAASGSSCITLSSRQSIQNLAGGCRNIGHFLCGLYPEEIPAKRKRLSCHGLAWRIVFQHSNHRGTGP